MSPQRAEPHVLRTLAVSRTKASIFRVTKWLTNLKQNPCTWRVARKSSSNTSSISSTFVRTLRPAIIALKIILTFAVVSVILANIGELWEQFEEHWDDFVEDYDDMVDQMEQEIEYPEDTDWDTVDEYVSSVLNTENKCIQNQFFTI